MTRRSRTLTAAVIVVLCAALAAACTHSDTTTADSADRQCAHCDSTIDAAVGPNVDSLSLAENGLVFVTVTGSTGTSRSVTFRSGVRDTSDPSNSPLHVASITKAFTARAVLGLVSENRVSLNTPARNYLAPARRTASVLSTSVTVAQLLHHTSGVADAPIRSTAGQSEDQRVDDYLAASLSDKAGSAIGEFHYANSNYLLLGQLLEDVTHRPAAQLLTEPAASTPHTFLATDTRSISGDHLAASSSVTEKNQLAVAWTLREEHLFSGVDSREQRRHDREFLHSRPSDNVHTYSIPDWRFFSPLPGTIDAHLYVRHEIAGQWTAWSSAMPSNPRSPVPMLINPGNRAHKVLIDLATSLYGLHAAHPDNFDRIEQSDPYRRLPATAGAGHNPPGARREQLMLLESTPTSPTDQGTCEPIAVTRPADIPTMKSNYWNSSS